MFRKLVDVLKEVFWIKPSRKRPKPARRKVVSAKGGSASGGKKLPAKKKIVKKILKPANQAKSKLKLKPPQHPVMRKSVLKATSTPGVINPSLVEVGEIIHYFDRIKVCVIKLTKGTVLIGDRLAIVGPKTKFSQKVWSMQIESEDVKVAKKGQLIGIKVDKLVVVGDKVYK